MKLKQFYLLMKKPFCVGFSIFDLKKLLLHEFLYNYIKRKLNANLLFTGTDSLVYEIQADDGYEDFYEDKYLFHFSDYPQDCFDNKK